MIEKAKHTAARKKDRLMKQLEGVVALREKYSPERTHLFTNFTMPECGIYLQNKKQSPKDPGMPKDLIMPGGLITPVAILQLWGKVQVTWVSISLISSTH